MNYTGWRKPTLGLGVAEQHAQAGERVSVPKSKAFVAVKRVGAHIGLKASHMMLLDTLGAFTQAQDWEHGRRPIVWPSNAYLMAQTGFSLSALKRHSRRLVEIGVISFIDSPNGKRWGHRDADGVIVEAYGFDLSPLSARVEEFEALHAELRAERELCQRLKRQITVARRMIRARIEAATHNALKGPWGQHTTTFDNLLSQLPRRQAASETLERLLAWFKALQVRVEATFLAATQPDNVVENPVSTPDETSRDVSELALKEVIFDTHIPTTKELIPVISNHSESYTIQNRIAKTRVEKREEHQFTKRDATTLKPPKTEIDLPTLMHASPEFASWARNIGGYIEDWGDLHRVATDLRSMIGVPEHIWHFAQNHLGKKLATAAFVLVFEKHCAGEIASPGGYLRGMVDKAWTGELHLERSFYGRLSERAA